MPNPSTGRSGKGSAHADTKPSVWEHAAAVLGAAIVVAVLGLMIYEAITVPSGAVPRVLVRIDSVVAAGTAGHVAEFRAINDGDATAADVQVEGELRGGAGVVERSEATIDFVPARSWRKGGLVFRADPRRHQLSVRVTGYDRP